MTATPTRPARQSLIFTGSGTTTVPLAESHLGDGHHGERVPCPGETASPSPTITPSPTPPPDSDSDGWSDAAEGVIGTDPLDACPDDDADDAWPADIDNDGFSDITDVSALTSAFGDSVPPAPARYDIAPDVPDEFVDVTDLSRMTGLFGQGCAEP